jgi:hypothetical protein
MEVSPNVDEMLLEAMAGQKLDPLPEKAAEEQPKEVSRETNKETEKRNEELHDSASRGTEKSHDNPDLLGDVDGDGHRSDSSKTNEYGDKAENGLEKADSLDSTNEYGLQTEAPRTFTKAEMDEYANRLMRERVARFERNQQQAQPTQQQQQAAAQQGFQYDENSNQDWQQQLEQFTMQVIEKREQTQAARYQQAVEQEQLQAFERKFKEGMSKYNDYHEVVGKFDIKDDMLLATKGIKDPAALFRAAALRAPDELAAISKMETKEERAFAMGQLDAKLKKQSVKVSSAPKPIQPTKADTTNAYTPKQVQSNELDDLLVQDKNNRLAQLSTRRR